MTRDEILKLREQVIQRFGISSWFAEDITRAITEAEEAAGLVVVPIGVLDLVRFLAATYVATDRFVYEHCDGDSLAKYPVIQGTSNQINLAKIAEQQHDTKRAATAVNWMLDAAKGES